MKGLQEGIKEARGKGRKVVLLGDFNSKIYSLEERWEGKDEKGREFAQWIEEQGLIVANGLKSCVGKWTRMQKESKSVLDYILIDSGLTVESMFIDDNGKYYIKSDHNLMVIRLQTKAMRQKISAKRVWKVEEDTDWHVYEELIGKKLEEKGVWAQVQQERVEQKSIERLSNSLAEAIKDAAEESVGSKIIYLGGCKRKKGGKGGIRWSKETKEAMKERAHKNKGWKKALKAGEEGIQDKWAKYQESREAVNELKEKDRRKNIDRRVEKCVSKHGGGKSRERAFWKFWKKAGRKSKGQGELRKGKRVAQTDTEKGIY
jgi:hypothetical protein